MKFKCGRIEVSNEELGCTVAFFENHQEDNSVIENRSLQQITDSIGTYLSLQCTYAEDEFENNYRTIELSEFERSSELVEFTIELEQTKFHIHWGGSDQAEVELDINKKEYDNLIDGLKRITDSGGKLNIRD